MGTLKAEAGQGHWGSLQGRSGAPVTTPDREPRVAMADPGTREAMAYSFWVARAGQGAPWPWS